MATGREAVRALATLRSTRGAERVGAIVLRTCYAESGIGVLTQAEMSGTDLGHAATLVLGDADLGHAALLLRRDGTDLGYAATLVLGGVSGTDLGHAATSPSEEWWGLLYKYIMHVWVDQVRNPRP
eukprot:1382321-Rhodomonas_salina.1